MKPGCCPVQQRFIELSQPLINTFVHVLHRLSELILLLALSLSLSIVVNQSLSQPESKSTEKRKNAIWTAANDTTLVNVQTKQQAAGNVCLMPSDFLAADFEPVQQIRPLNNSACYSELLPPLCSPQPASPTFPAFPSPPHTLLSLALKTAVLLWASISKLTGTTVTSLVISFGLLGRARLCI